MRPKDGAVHFTTLYTCQAPTCEAKTALAARDTGWLVTLGCTSGMLFGPRITHMNSAVLVLKRLYTGGRGTRLVELIDCGK